MSDLLDWLGDALRWFCGVALVLALVGGLLWMIHAADRVEQRCRAELVASRTTADSVRFVMDGCDRVLDGRR